jgi:hypothetical protein
MMVSYHLTLYEQPAFWRYGTVLEFSVPQQDHIVEGDGYWELGELRDDQDDVQWVYSFGLSVVPFESHHWRTRDS